MTTFSDKPSASNKEENGSSSSWIEEEVLSDFPDDFQCKLCVVHNRIDIRGCLRTSQELFLRTNIFVVSKISQSK